MFYIKISKSLEDYVISPHASIPHYQQLSTHNPTYHSTPTKRHSCSKQQSTLCLVSTGISPISYTNFCLKCSYYLSSLFSAQQTPSLSSFTFTFFEKCDLKTKFFFSMPPQHFEVIHKLLSYTFCVHLYALIR